MRKTRLEQKLNDLERKRLVGLWAGGGQVEIDKHIEMAKAKGVLVWQDQ